MGGLKIRLSRYSTQSRSNRASESYAGNISTNSAGGVKKVQLQPAFQSTSRASNGSESQQAQISAADESCAVDTVLNPADSSKSVEHAARQKIVQKENVLHGGLRPPSNSQHLVTDETEKDVFEFYINYAAPWVSMKSHPLVSIKN